MRPASLNDAFMLTTEFANRWSYAITLTPPLSSAAGTSSGGAPLASRGVSSNTVSKAMREVSEPRLTCTSITSTVRIASSLDATCVFMYPTLTFAIVTVYHSSAVAGG